MYFANTLIPFLPCWINTHAPFASQVSADGKGGGADILRPNAAQADICESFVAFGENR